MPANHSISPSPTTDAPRKTLWQRRIVEPIMAQLKQGVTPDKIALTLAVGVACGLFPFLGTWMLCFVVAVALRLNQPIIQIVNQLLWPIHIPAIPFWFWLGTKLFNLHYNLDEVLREFNTDQTFAEWLRMLFSGAFWGRFGKIFLCGVLVWLASVPIIIAGIYYPVRPIMRKLAALRLARLTRKEQTGSAS
ncbi:MAG: DUF2062 domain-containing protein [Nibricoccus sp.]